MEVEKIFDTTTPSTKDRKVFTYPFLFDVNLDEGITQNELEVLNTWDCDMVLECLQPLSCEVFRQAFTYSVCEESDEAEYAEYAESSGNVHTLHVDYEELTTLVEPLHAVQNYFPVPSPESLKWTTTPKGINHLNKEMDKLFHADYVVAGRVFTSSVLKFGSIGNYYLQYLANGLFGHPNAVMAIQNRKHIMERFTQSKLAMFQKEEMLKRLAEQLYLIFVEVAPERWQDSSGQFPFSKGDIMECMIRIRGNIHMSRCLPIAQHVQIQTLMKQLFHSSTICDDEGNLYPQTWKLRFVLL